ncbi:MAG: hypothetical protein WA741_33835 [Candidatus Sulfotelmatobacter sp.]
MSPGVQRFCAMLVAAAACLALAGPADGQNSTPQDATQSRANVPVSPAQTEEHLAEEVRNPLAALTQVQLSNDFDFGAAGGNGFLYTFMLQPIVPFKISDNWNLITRSAFTATSVPDSEGSGRTTGTGDSDIQFYFSHDRARSFIWGFGPVLGIPTASNSLLGSGKWTLGPGFAIVRQTEDWTYGILVNQFWSFAGGKNRDSVTLMLLHPVFSYTWKSGWSLGLDSESTYDAKASSSERWTVPLQISISKEANFGKRPVNLSFGVIPYAVAPSGSPSVGLNFTITRLFPKEGAR